MLNIISKPPSECADSELDSFHELVTRNWQVSKENLMDRIRNAKALVFLYDDDRMIGVGAIKKPLESYKKRIFRSAGMAGAESEFTYEAGYVFIVPEYRGRLLSRDIQMALLAEADGLPVFATTREDNEPMQRTLRRFGFERAGSFYSTRGDYMLELFLWTP